MTKPVLTIMRGVSGSGKSTIARSQFGAMVVSRDDLRVAMFGSDGPEYYNVPKPVLRAREDAITEAEHAAIRGALRAGINVISDNTNIRMQYVKPIANIGYSEGAEVKINVVDVPLAVAIERNVQRAAMGGRNVPEKVIREQHAALQQSKGHTLTPPAPVEPYRGTPGKPKAFMYDLDGTVYHMNNKRGPYALNVLVDDPDETVQRVINAIATATGWVPIAMSGRKEGAREDTITAMERDGLVFDHLFMRGDEDNRADNLIKADLFNEHVRDHYDVQLVIDDRWQVCQMWLTMGLKVFNVSGLDRGEF